jgi:hypothetical protein
MLGGNSIGGFFFGFFFDRHVCLQILVAYAKEVYIKYKKVLRYFQWDTYFQELASVRHFVGTYDKDMILVTLCGNTKGAITYLRSCSFS